MGVAPGEVAAPAPSDRGAPRPSGSRDPRAAAAGPPRPDPPAPHLHRAPRRRGLRPQPPAPGASVGRGPGTPRDEHARPPGRRRQRGPRGLTRLAGSVAAAAQASLPGTATGSSAPCPSRPSSWPGSVLAGTAQRGRASPTHRPLPRPPPRPRPARRRALGAVTSSRSAACHAARLEGGRGLGATAVTCGTGVPASVSRGPSPRLSGWLHYRPS